MSRKQILLVGPFPPPIGGDTVCTSNLARSRHWAERGIAVSTISTSAGDRVRLPGEPLSARDIVRAFRIMGRVLGALPRSGALMLWANSRFLCTVGSVILGCAWIIGKPSLVKPFGSSFVERYGGCGRLHRRFVRVMLRRASLVLPETNHLAGWFREEVRLEPGRIVSFPNFIPDRFLAPLPAAKEPSGACVFVGQIKREKGVFDIIEALRGRDDIRCDFYGPIVDRDRERFLSQVSESDALRYEGIADPGGIRELVARYDILLLPTYHPGEGYPAVILEALSAGVPVVTTEWRSIPEIVHDGVTGLLVPVTSPVELGRAIDRLLGDPVLYRGIRKRAYDAAASFSEERVIGGILIPRLERLWEERRGVPPH